LHFNFEPSAYLDASLPNIPQGANLRHVSDYPFLYVCLADSV